MKFQCFIEHNDIEDDRLITYLEKKEELHSENNPNLLNGSQIRPSSVKSGRLGSNLTHSSQISGFDILADMTNNRMKAYKEAEKSSHYAETVKFNNVGHYDIRVKSVFLS